MKFHRFNPTAVAAFAATALLAACGGTGSGTSSGSSSINAAAVSQLTGTAATGAALAGASVKVTNGSKVSSCTESSIKTEKDGTFACTLKPDEAAPFFIVVTDPLGNTPPLVSIGTQTPAAGGTEQVNATSLTTAIVAQLNGGDALGVVDNPAALYNASSLDAIKTNVVSQIQGVLNAVDPAALQNYDPFRTPITAATSTTTGNAADRVLDIIKFVKTEDGQAALATVTNPTPVLMAGTSPAATNVPAPAAAIIASVNDLGLAVQQVAQGFSKCFALPLNERVTLDSNQSITQMAAPCNEMVTREGSPTGAVAFKHDGRGAARWFYNLLVDEKMTGATFAAAEVMAMYPADAANPRDTAVFNAKYVDNQGTPGNIIVMGENIPASATPTHSSTWWITGNQKSFDLRVHTTVSRRQKFFGNDAGDFRNGLDFRINGATTAPRASEFDVVLVQGAGLPTTGLWYGRRDGIGLFAMSSNRGGQPPLLKDLNSVCNSCISYWMGRTQGLNGEAAEKLRENVTQANFSNATDGSYYGTTGKRPTKGETYTFSLYKAGALVATETRRLLTDLTPATQANKLPWHEAGDNLLAALAVTNPALNGEQTSLLIDWRKNPAAEPVRSVFISQNNGGNDNATPFAIGATSVVATPVGTGNKFTALTGPLNESTLPYGGYRDIGMSYRTVDGSSKSDNYSYFP